MTIKVQLVKDGKVVVELPLDREEWRNDELESQLEEFELTLDAATEMHDFFSNKMRSMMLSEIVRSSDRRFSELMDILDANQKIVNENLQRMVRKGLVNRVQKKRGEVHYLPSGRGFASVLVCIAMRRILDELEE